MNNILILSVEGIESNTEVNFFNGLSHHLKKSKLKIYAIGKQSDTTKSKNRIIRSIKSALLRNPNISYDHIFFIGDGDVPTDFPSMNRAVETAIEVLIDINGESSGIHIPFIKNEGESIEQTLSRISTPLFFPNDKKLGSNHGLFNTYAEKYK